ncbi:MAG TPA: nitrous oxide reductase family maturation protein NosD [Gemmatimonadales bacterium]|nr:nitrous oxide reductase family maturation protein NosD [Gemmatimonadales bacterium]
MLSAALLLQAQLLVSPSGPYRSLGEAVRAAPPGSTITVSAGVYREPTVQVDRAVTIAGEQGAIMDGEGERGLIEIVVPGVTVRGLNFRNTGTSYREDRAAVRVIETGDCTIADNRFEDTFFAVYLQGSRNCTVTGNRIRGVTAREATTGNGIHSWGSSGIVIRGNTVSGHRDGIYLEFSRHSTVDDNLSEGNRRYGLHFMYSDSSAYAGNTFRENGAGVAVMFSRLITMTRNSFSGNRGPAAYGLLLKDIADARLEQNTFSDNTTALVADGASRIQALGNRFSRNGRAVRLLASSDDGRFSGNRFEGNSFDVVVNSRSIRADFTGNWWDAYRGWDLDRDGVGDVPHHPVRLFTLLVERSEPALLLQRTLMVRLMDAAERAMPVLTPTGIVDAAPLVRPTGPGETR